MNIPKIDLSEYKFVLPSGRISKYQLKDRSKAKLLVANKSTEAIIHKEFWELPSLVNSEVHFVFNQTKVINARLFFKKESGGKVEIFCLNPIPANLDPQIALLTKKSVDWQIMIGGKSIVAGQKLFSDDEEIYLIIYDKNENLAKVTFYYPEEMSFLDVLEKIGKVPIPPYLKRNSTEDDKRTYQTVFAKNEGSVAAPTAALHFTPKIFSNLKKKGISNSNIDLHIGAGTFQPINTDKIENHIMHSELVKVSKKSVLEIQEALQKNKKILCVGTTSVRTIESLFIFGEKLERDNYLEEFNIDQWDGFNSTLDKLQSLENVIKWLENNNLESIVGSTKLLIIPGYKFRAVDQILTNFHQPDSTLILLIAAFLGKDFQQKVYKNALDENYRFLSFGDSSYLF